MRPRMRPSLIIVGTQKAGTSALYHMLNQHPKVVGPSIKEVDHFGSDASYAKGMRHYLSHFPVVPVTVRGYITFEASPSYLSFAEIAAPRIAKHMPTAYCMALLRDPVKRAYSSWNMYRDFKHFPRYVHLHDPRSFEEAVNDELAGRTIKPYHRYLLRSSYADQVTHYKKAIRPDKLLIHSYLYLKREPVAFMTALCETLGLEPFAADHPVFQVKANARAYPGNLDPALATELYQYFAPEMMKLRDVLGYDIDIMEGHG